MKNNYSESEVSNIKSTFSSAFNVRVNRAGNIELKPIDSNNNDFFVLYFTANKRYLWRRLGNGMFGTYIYPLNMKNRYRTSNIESYSYEGKTYKYYLRHWNIEDCKFDSIDDAINYFKDYIKKYRNITIL